MARRRDPCNPLTADHAQLHGQRRADAPHGCEDALSSRQRHTNNRYSRARPTGLPRAMDGSDDYGRSRRRGILRWKELKPPTVPRTDYGSYCGLRYRLHSILSCLVLDSGPNPAPPTTYRHRMYRIYGAFYARATTKLMALLYRAGAPSAQQIAFFS